MGNLETTIHQNIARIHVDILHAAEHANRDPAEVTLVAVSKTIEIERIQIAIQAGLHDFGENRVQELREKAMILPQVTWEMIGPLQRNKIRPAVQYSARIHSVDSLILAAAINRIAGESGKTMPVLIEVNVAHEATKHGVLPDDVPALARQIIQLPHLIGAGLMTVAPNVANPEDNRPIFTHMRSMRDHLLADTGPSWSVLSMGMSDDYSVAIEEGATVIRIGRAIFGDRLPMGADHVLHS